MALTKTKLQNQLKEIVEEGQTFIDIEVEAGRMTKAQARHARREMLYRIENALYNCKDAVMLDLTIRIEEASK